LAQKGLLLDLVVATTGYARKYAINQAPEGKRTIQRSRLSRYGPEVQQALLEAWKVAKHICAKRLIPFLPTLVTTLERHGHLQLTNESRGRLLAVSATIAERCLRAHRKPAPGRPGITQTGPLLKDQLPVRTFQQWGGIRLLCCCFHIHRVQIDAFLSYLWGFRLLIKGVLPPRTQSTWADGALPFSWHDHLLCGARKNWISWSRTEIRLYPLLVGVACDGLLG